jgi:hypothetical protein
MSNRISWAFDPTVVVTSFTITKSVDKGITYAALTSVAFNTTGANWDKAKKRFFYVDAPGNPGDIYLVTSVGAFGTSPGTYAIAPPTSPAFCYIFGYILDSQGNVDQQTPITVRWDGSRGEHWMKGPTGTVAQNPEALAITAGSMQVYPDANGMWQVQLIQKSFARIQIPAIELDWAFEVPSKPGPINIRDVQQLRGLSTGIFSDMTGTRENLPNS